MKDLHGHEIPNTALLGPNGKSFAPKHEQVPPPDPLQTAHTTITEQKSLIADLRAEVTRLQELTA